MMVGAYGVFANYLAFLTNSISSAWVPFLAFLILAAMGAIALAGGALQYRKRTSQRRWSVVVIVPSLLSLFLTQYEYDLYLAGFAGAIVGLVAGSLGVLEATPWPKERRQRLAAVFMVLLLIGGIAGWWFWRPMTAYEVDHRFSWSVGPQGFQDTIRSLAYVNTSYGPQVFLGFGDDICGASSGWTALGDPSATYRVGDSYSTTLHFRPYEYNGVAAISAPELGCPFPGLPIAIKTVVHAVSLHFGLQLKFAPGAPAGWTAFELRTPNGDTYPMDLGPAGLVRFPRPPADLAALNGPPRWVVHMATEYVQWSAFNGTYPAEWAVDELRTFAQGNGTNGRLRFDDVNRDGRVGDLDRISVRLDPTGDNGKWAEYVVTVGGPMYDSLVFGMEPILNGPRGPYEVVYNDLPEDLQLSHTGETLGASPSSLLMVNRVLDGTPRPIAEHTFQLQGLSGSFTYSGALQAGTQAFQGLNLTFVDVSGNGLVDAGDTFTVTGLANRTEVFFDLFSHDVSVGSLRWFAGYGHVMGTLPAVTINGSGQNPYVFEASMAYEHAEFDLGKTLRVSLVEDGATAIDHADVKVGAVGSFAGGNLTFEDKDGDLRWSSGDAFTVQAGAKHRYELTVSVLFDTFTYFGHTA
jgi:hypothetical protein